MKSIERISGENQQQQKEWEKKSPMENDKTEGATREETEDRYLSFNAQSTMMVISGWTGREEIENGNQMTATPENRRQEGLTPDLISQPPFRGGSREFISSD